MACIDCPKGVTYTDADNKVAHEPHSRVDHGGPVTIYEGEALSTACERYTGVGQIPRVLAVPGATFVRGKAVAGVPSNGGIQNPVSFFKSTEGDCYTDGWAKLASACC